MSRLSAATIVLIAFVAASFGSNLWLDAAEAKRWGELAGYSAVAWVWCLVIARGER